MIKDGEDKHGLKTFQDAKSLKTRTRFIIDIWFSNKGSTENCMLVKRRQNGVKMQYMSHVIPERRKK